MARATITIMQDAEVPTRQIMEVAKSAGQLAHRIALRAVKYPIQDNLMEKDRLIDDFSNTEFYQCIEEVEQ
jgi:hypothetical protein